MPNVKPTEAGQKQREEYLKELRARRENVRKSADLKENDGWKEYRKIVERFIDTEKARREGLNRDAGRRFDSSDRPILAEHVMRDIACSVAIQETYEMLLGIVDNSEEQLNAIDSQTKKYEKQYKEAAQILE